MKKPNRHKISFIIFTIMMVMVMGNVSASPKYYTFEGEISWINPGDPDSYMINVEGLYYGYPVKYVMMVDTDKPGFQTLSTGEVIFFEDTETVDYFYVDHIYGDHIKYQSANIPSTLEWNVGQDFLDTHNIWLHGDNGDVAKLVYSYSANGPMDEWVVGNGGTAAEGYALDTVSVSTNFNARVTLVDISDTSPVMTVDIDVQPRSANNIVRLSSKNPLKVAILSSESFDATSVDPESIRLGMGGAIADRPKAKDTNGDGVNDLLLRFNTSYTWIQCGDTEVTLTAETYSGQMITGTDPVSTAQCD